MTEEDQPDLEESPWPSSPADGEDGEEGIPLLGGGVQTGAGGCWAAKVLLLLTIVGVA